MLVCPSETAWVESVVRGGREIEFIDNGSDIILRLNQQAWSDEEDDGNASQPGADYRQLLDHCNYPAPQAESCRWKSSRIDDFGKMAAPLQPNALYEIRFYKIDGNATLLHNLSITRNSTSVRGRRSTSKEENRNSYTLPLAFRTPSPGKVDPQHEYISHLCMELNEISPKSIPPSRCFFHMCQFRSKLLLLSFTLI